MIQMNQYKMDWYLATQSVSDYLLNRIIASEDERLTTAGIARDMTVEHTMEMVGRGVMTWAIPTIMKHMAQNQIKGTIGIMGRVGGRLGLRVVPVIGTILLVKDAYDLYEFLTDD